MRIVIALPDETESGQLASLLRSAGHAVTAARDEASIGAALEGERPELALLGGAPGEDLLSLVRKASSAPTRPYVLFLHSGVADEMLAQLLEAGADGDLKRPLSRRSFMARLAAIQRRVQALGAGTGSANAVARPAAASAPATPIDTASRSEVWRSVLPRLREAAESFLTMNVTRTELPAEFVPVGLGASIVLLSAAAQLELRISIAVDAVSAEGLAVHLFGSGDQELAQEVLNELANIFMGRIKTALSAEGHSFTGGLPETTAVDVVLRPAMPYRFQETAMLTAGDARLVVFAGLRSRANIVVFPNALREGLVLAKDVLNARGVLLLNGGIRLSENMVERLKSNLTPKHEIEVIAP